MQTQFFVGTASWQEPDFITHWYPKGLPKTKDIRQRATVTRDKVDLTAKMEKLVAQRFRAGIQPLLDAKKLGALLLQLSPSFQPHDNHLSELENIFGLFEDFPLAVELRNRAWLTGEQTHETVAFFTKHNLCLVSVDAPETEHFTAMPNTDYLTTPKMAYLRAHGRNAEAYITGRTVQERFDHDYLDQELTQIGERLARFDQRAQKVFAVFNNNRQHFAPKAAAKLNEYLKGASPNASLARPIRAKQFSLF